MIKTGTRILILGSLDEFSQLVQMAKVRDCFTIVCDGNANGPAKDFADMAVDIDVREIDRIVALCHDEQVDYIITSFSDLLFECMVHIADKANLPCYIKSSQIDFYRDKAVMKSTLDELNIPTPRHLLLDSDFDESKLSSLTFPVVTKPLDMYGSRGIFVLDTPSQVKEYFKKACQTSARQEILVEEYNSDYEFNMMTWVLDGEVKVLSIADREKTATTPNEIPYGSRNVYPSCLIHEVYDDAMDILTRFIAKTGQSQGPLSMQFFYSPERGVQVGEIAGRFFGYEHELLEYCSGLSIEQLLLDYCLDNNALKNDLENHTPFFQTVSAVIYFQAHDGVIANQSETLSISDKEHVKKLQLFYQVGEHITTHGPQPYAARVYATANSRNAVDELTRQICEEISITDNAGNELLYQNQIPTYTMKSNE